MKKYIYIFSVIIVVLTLVVLVVPVFAQEESSVSPTPKPIRSGLFVKDRIQAAHQKNLEIRENMKNRAASAAAKRKEKLSEARIRICKARQKGISQRAKFMLERGKKINKGHEKIYTRVDTFYNEKLVPAGYTLPNYADLTAEIEANKANVLDLIESAKATGSAEFNCDSDDPLGQIDAFKEDMKELIEANRAYKESIHNFAKAVRDLAKTARLDKLSPSPSPALTPEVSP